MQRLGAPGARLACALALALPAYLLTNETFRPVEVRVQLEGRQASQAFPLTSREPLYLEFELTFRAAGDERPAAVFTLNGARVTTVTAEALHAPQGGRLLLPFPTVRTGENRLDVEIGGPPSATFELRARVHNYYGIAPDFPRIFVVADDSVTYFASQYSGIGRGLRFGAFGLASALLLWGVGRVSGRRSAAGTYLLLLSPAALLWVALVYGLLTPQHIWLSLEALLTACVAGLALAATALWVVAHGAGVARFAAVAAVTLILLEAALRVVNYLSPSFVFYSDDYGRYRGQPGAPYFDTHLNSRGFNDLEHLPVRPAGVACRVVAIGDSFALGVVPYRANYLTLLEADLIRDAPAEVINMGVAGTEPADYLSILANEGLAFAPDLVMVGFFIGNDFEAAARKPYEYSYVATFGHVLWRLWGARPPAPASPDAHVVQYEDDQPSLTADRFLDIEVDRARIFADAGLMTAAARAGGSLREMRDLSRRAGADFVVVLIPDEMQVDDALQDRVARDTSRPRAQFDFQRPNRLITAELASQGVRVLDLLPAFAHEGRQTRLYKPQDTHWNLAGNRLAAATIAGFLRQERLGCRPAAK